MEFFTIGEVSKLCNIPVKTLRYYDEIGLLKPDKISKENNYRYYSKVNTLKIPLIKYYKQLGFRLEDINQVIHRLDINILEDFFAKELKAVEKEMADLQKKHFAITEWLQLLKHGESYLIQSGHIDIQTIPDYKTVHFKYTLESRQDYAEMLYSNSFVEICHQNNAFAYGPFMLYFGSIEERMNNTFTEIDCYTSVIEDAGNTIETRSIGNFRAVTTVHKGDYSTIGDTYQSVMNWADEREISLQGAAYERNIIDPWSTLVSEHYVTELILPISSSSL